MYYPNIRQEELRPELFEPKKGWSQVTWLDFPHNLTTIAGQPSLTALTPTNPVKYKMAGKKDYYWRRIYALEFSCFALHLFNDELETKSYRTCSG
jgi:hypothetical protein